MVRSAIMELGWRIHFGVAEFVDDSARAFADALPRPLTAEERRVFNHLYLSKACFGNMPLIMLWVRAEFLKQVILDIWQSPRSRATLAVLYRLLEYYSIMAPHRRHRRSDPGTTNAA